MPDSTANTEVTFAVPLGRMKHAPLINRSCATLQSPVDGVTEIITGALNPRSSAHVVVRVNPPTCGITLKMLLLPAENVVVNVNVPNPPQQVSGNAVPMKPVAAGAVNVPLTRLMLVGVTTVNAVKLSATPSPLVSQPNDKAEVTVLPGRCNGTPVSLEKP